MVRRLHVIGSLTLLFATAASAWGLPAEYQADSTPQPRYVSVREGSPDTTSDRGAEVDPPTKQAALVLHQIEQAAYQEALWELERPTPEIAFLADFRHFVRAEALYGLQRYEQAAASYLLASQLPESRWHDLARTRRAQTFDAAGECVQAVSAYEEVLVSFPDHPDRPEIEVAIAACQKRLGFAQDAANRFYGVWLSWPTTPQATVAHTAIRGLLTGKVALHPPEAAQIMERVAKLRRAWRIEEALADLRLLKGTDPVLDLRVDWELALTYRRVGHYESALAVLQHLKREYDHGRETPGIRRSQLIAKIADLLSRLNRVDEALTLLTVSLPEHLERTDEQILLQEALDIAAAHAHFGTAVEFSRQLMLHTSRKAKRREIDAELAWYTYRSGGYDDAIQFWERSDTEFSRYWRARAHQKAGRRQIAIKLYRQLLDTERPTYYEQLARSRLAEMKLLRIRAHGPCDPLPQSDPTNVMDMLDAVASRFATALPALARARAFWRSGAYSQARRELRLVAIDYGYAISRGKDPTLTVDPSVHRLWRGGPTEGLNQQSKRQSSLRDLVDHLGPVLTRLLQIAGVDYWGWRLSDRTEDEPRDEYPRPYAELIEQTAAQFAIEPHFLWSVMRTESHYRPDAASPAGAMGLMQIMPHTGRRLAEDLDVNEFSPSHLFQPELNLKFAGHYLSALLRKFDYQIPLAAAGYNGGPHNVAHWLDLRGSKSAMDEFVEEIPYRETRRYAKNIVERLAIYDHTYCRARDGRLVSNQLDANYAAYPAF